MDISKVTDVTELKALAYDIMRERERLRSNLDLIMQRITELEQQSSPSTNTRDKK